MTFSITLAQEAENCLSEIANSACIEIYHWLQVRAGFFSGIGISSSDKRCNGFLM